MRLDKSLKLFHRAFPSSLLCGYPFPRPCSDRLVKKTFLTAEWRHLALLNFSIEPSILKPLVPTGTELDYFQGKTYVSVVGFRFLNTRVHGIPFPLHRNFEEVNLRFYVRRRCGEEWRRGVVFIRELVPRRIIAFMARTFYGEPYLALPMRHRIETSNLQMTVEYAWKRRGSWESLKVVGAGEPQNIESGSEEEFITEHYWGYTARSSGCSEYQVEHPRWRVWHGIQSELRADIEALYGERFRETLSARPISAFIADGSVVTVRKAGILQQMDANQDAHRP